MRILQVIAGEKWTGAAAVVFDQTAALVEAGIEAQFAFVRDSPLAERLLPLGWARPLFHRRPHDPLAYARDVRSLRGTILRERFDIVHAHGSHDHYVAAFALRGTPVRLARTLHHVRHVRRNPASRLLFRRTDAFAFSNRTIAKRFGSPGPIHPPVIDTACFCPREMPAETLSRLGIPQSLFLVGTVGKMAKGRGHLEAIEAVSRLPESVGLVHVGHGELMPDLRARAAILGSGNRNFWLGYQEEILPDLYRTWHALLFTASGSEQGQRAILEAMASGVPVVALDAPGVRDLMTDGQEGFIVRNMDELPAALIRLHQSEQMRRQLASRARARAFAFTAERFVPKAREFYERLSNPMSSGSGKTLGP